MYGIFMANTQESKEKIPVDRLVKGLYVDLELHWSQHPFLFSKFKIKSEKDLLAIKELGLTEVTVIPERSNVDIPQVTSAEQTPPNSKSALDDLWTDKNTHIDQANHYRNRRRDVARRYEEQAKKVRKMVTELKSQPANAIHNADEVIEDLAASFTNQQDMLTNLVNLGTGNHSVYNHSINVIMLSFMLGAAEGLSPEQMRELGMGALLHDIGKIEIPSAITGKITALSRTEAKTLERHTIFGRKLVERVRNLPNTALDIIEQHHEHLDGTGYPHGLPAAKLSPLVRIVTVANTYDNLCNPRDPANAVPPKTALAMMYTKFKDKLDRQLIERFIRSLGVYPPGTVVRLSDDSIGLVVAVDPQNLLKPEVLLYNPEIPKEKALIINLKDYDELEVRDVLLPGDYPQRIYEYLGIEERLGYFIEQKPI